MAREDLLEGGVVVTSSDGTALRWSGRSGSDASVWIAGVVKGSSFMSTSSLADAAASFVATWCGEVSGALTLRRSDTGGADS